MTTAQMVTSLIDLLDDTSSGTGFFTTDMYYEALSAGQRGVASFINRNNPDSPAVKFLLKEDSITGGYSKALPSDFERINVATYAYDGSNYKLCKEVSYKEHIWNTENPFLSPSKNVPVVYIKGETALGGKYYFHPTNGATSNATLNYWAIPTDIDGSTEPAIKVGHDAIVQYALHWCLNRNKEEDKAKLAYSEFERLASLL